MNPILERDGTGAVEGHSAAEALRSLLGSMERLMDGCPGNSPGGPPHDRCKLTAELLPPVQVLATELRRQHGDDASVRLGIMDLEQRMRDHANPNARASGTAS